MHTDPDLLALLALGEDVGTDERLHVRACVACADELAQLTQLVTLGRTTDPDTALSSPSHDVWSRIRAELGLDLALEPPAVVPSTATTPSTAPGDSLTAHAQLAPVAPLWSDAWGKAELATDARGRRVLQVDLHAELPTSGLRQAWLIHREDPTQRQTLGILDGTHGLWTIDHSIDLESFAIFDVSQQGVGQIEHSGHTIVRGELVLVS